MPLGAGKRRFDSRSTGRRMHFARVEVRTSVDAQDYCFAVDHKMLMTVLQRKSTTRDIALSIMERELAIKQIVSRAVVSTEIVDIMKAAGLESPDISILSDDFLAQVRDSDKI